MRTIGVRRRKKRQRAITSPSLERMFEEELTAAKRRLGERKEGGCEREASDTETAEGSKGAPQVLFQQDGDGAALPSGHRSGSDAYMTGYCFCCYALMLAGEKLVAVEKRDVLLSEVKNKVTLAGKGFPLLLSKSSYTVTSPHHRAMAERTKEMFEKQ